MTLNFENMQYQDRDMNFNRANSTFAALVEGRGVVCADTVAAEAAAGEGSMSLDGWDD